MLLKFIGWFACMCDGFLTVYITALLYKQSSFVLNCLNPCCFTGGQRRPQQQRGRRRGWGESQQGLPHRAGPLRPSPAAPVLLLLVITSSSSSSSSGEAAPAAARRRNRERTIKPTSHRLFGCSGLCRSNQCAQPKQQQQQQQQCGQRQGRRLGLHLQRDAPRAALPRTGAPAAALPSVPEACHLWQLWGIFRKYFCLSLKLDQRSMVPNG
jgi:hypothetical protein